MWTNAMWVGLPDKEIADKQIFHGDLTGRFAYYRHTFELNNAGKLVLHITANSRYRLWVNGTPVTSGPCKGDLHRHYYETVDVSECLRIGKNVLAVQVLYLDHYAAVKQQDERASIQSVYTPGGTHRLAVEGAVTESGEPQHSVTTGEAQWRVWLDGSYFLKSQEVTNCMGSVCEEPDFGKIPHNWKHWDFDDSLWVCANPLETVKIDHFMRTIGLLQRFPITERPIPLMYERPEGFLREVRSNSGILGNDCISIPAGSSKEIVLDAGVEVNAYPAFRFSGGNGSRVKIIYSEKFAGGKTKDDPEGKIAGITDTLILDGMDITFEPFWYRTFRFISIEVFAGEDTIVYCPTFRKTGYPLLIESEVRSSEKWVEEVWQLCVRTLENCMMETYMDCPYYEQNQFPMDTRLQALFCGVVSNDRQLTMKALEDFHCSITPNGLVHGRYPGSYQQIISTFSLYYIYMLEDTFVRYDNMNELKRYLPDLDRILAYYDSRIGEDGLVGRLGYWEFVDWQPKWARLGGVPEAVEHGPSTIINLMYALALEKAAVLWESEGRTALAEEYRMRKTAILETVQTLCWDAQKEMYREGPSFCQYTQHAQSWAVLNQMVSGKQAKAVLRAAMRDPDVLRVTFSTSFEWFRALEMAGLYDETATDMAAWAALPAMGNTTCPEVPGDSRSECHAWSALPIYEFACTMAGIRVKHSAIEIRPNLSYLPDLEGTVITPWGPVRYHYQKEDNLVRCKLNLPPKANVVLLGRDGSVKYLYNETVEILY